MNGSRWLETSVRVYAALLYAYPASFRQRYGGEMTWVFRELAADALRRRGALGLIVQWCRVLGDLALTAPRERLAEPRRSLDMRAAVRVVSSAVVAVVAYHVVMATVGIVLAMVGLIVSGGSHGISPDPLLEWTFLLLPPFLTGMLLTQAKPLFRPAITAPLSVASYWAVALTLMPGDPSWWLRVGLVVCLGLVTLVGCVVGRKATGHFERCAVPASLLAGTSAILISTFAIACVLWLVLAGSQLDGGYRPALIASLYGLALIAALTIANLIMGIAKHHNRRERFGRSALDLVEGA